jgi:NAD(P)-dependent dehydrogenase (short-subunit alcohol dehydrogenase family)
MVNIKDVRISNSSLSAKPSGIVALFIGGTGGIGKGTLKQFAKYAKAPKVYIVGRSKNAASPLLDELKTLNPQGTFIFIESEISLIKNVDAVCEEIKEKQKILDFIFLSPGYLTLEGRQGTPIILPPLIEDMSR